MARPSGAAARRPSAPHGADGSVFAFNRVWIIEDFGCLSEGYSVLGKILNSLLVVPFKLHSSTFRYRTFSRMHRHAGYLRSVAAFGRRQYSKRVGPFD